MAEPSRPANRREEPIPEYQDVSHLEQGEMIVPIRPDLVELPEAVVCCQEERGRKISELSPGARERVLEIERQLHQIRRDFAQICTGRCPCPHAIQGVFRSLQTLGQTYPELETQFLDVILRMPFESSTMESFFIYSELVLNSLVSKAHYVEEVGAVIREHMSTIADYFGISARTDFRLEFVSNETHKGGKLPMTVVFMLPGQEEKRCMYKPRAALIDISVIDSFARINEMRSQDPNVFPLPTFRILRLPGEKGSIWEYIHGMPPPLRRGGYPISAWQFIRKLQSESSINPKQAEILYRKLNRLEAILRRMHISDLHGSNVIFAGLDGPNPEIYVVDLEVVRPEATQTQLGGDPSGIAMTQLERREIQACVSRQFITPYRYLPLSSQEISNLVQQYENIAVIENTIRKAMLGDGFRVIISQAQLQKLLYIDMLNQDTPFLQVSGNDLQYYSEGIPIIMNLS